MEALHIEVIRMQSSGYGGGEPCTACGRPSSPFHGLPVFNGDVMSNDWQGEWGGVPCCEACFENHERGEMQTHDAMYEHLLGMLVNGLGI